MQQELSQSGSESRINLAAKMAAAAAANTATEMIDYMTAENIKYSCINFGFCLFRLFFFYFFCCSLGARLPQWQRCAPYRVCVSRARRDDGAVFVCAFVAKAAAADAAIAIDVLVGAHAMASASCKRRSARVIKSHIADSCEQLFMP